MKYPRSNARAFFHHERCPTCGSGMIDWRGSERRCASCGMPTTQASRAEPVAAGLEVSERSSFRGGREGFFPDA